MSIYIKHIEILWTVDDFAGIFILMRFSVNYFSRYIQWMMNEDIIKQTWFEQKDSPLSIGGNLQCRLS